MMPNGTRLLNGKGFLHKIDHRTPTYNVQLDEFVSIGWMVPWKNQAETDAGLKREFALALVNQTSLWCFDMWGGVFKTPETMQIVKQSKRLWDAYTATPLKGCAEGGAGGGSAEHALSQRPERRGDKDLSGNAEQIESAGGAL